LIKNWLPTPEGISHSQNFSQKFDQKLASNPGGHFSLANFSQKFDQKLASNPGGQFLLDCEEVYRQTPPGGQFLLDFL
jgi:hypothetical protein